MSLTFPPSEWLYGISLTIAIAALGLSLHMKPKNGKPSAQGIDVADCSREFWEACNRAGLRIFEEGRTEHIEVLYSRYRGFGRNHRTTREDFGGMLSYMVGALKESYESLVDTYDFYKSQTALRTRVDEMYREETQKLRTDCKIHFENKRLWANRNRIRNTDLIAVIAIVALASLFFLGTDDNTIFVRDSLICGGFVVAIVFFSITLWVNFDIDRFERKWQL